MLTFLPLLLASKRPCVSFVRPHSMCVHAKATTRKPVDKQWKESEKSTIKRHKANEHDRQGKHRMNACKRVKETANKQAGKQTKGGVCEGQM